jgi:cytoskeletal protein CcmA (bactofilin family)
MAKLLGGTRIYGNANVDSILYVNGGINSTSNTTGSIVVSGGVGVTGSLYTGNVAVVGVNPLIGFTGNASVISTGRELVIGSTGDQLGAMYMRMQNRTGQNGPLFDGGSLGLIDFGFLSSSIQRNIRFETRNASTILGSPSSEFQFGLAGNPSFVSNDTVVLVNTTGASTSNSTGAFRVNGGAGIKGNVYSGGIYITGTGNGITFVDGTRQTTNAAPFAYTQASFDKANTAANSVTQNPQSTTYSLTTVDAGKYVYYKQSANVILYIPNSGSVPFINGSTIMVVSKTTSSANVTITPNTGVSLYLVGNTTSQSRNVTTYGMATLFMAEANTWYINGTGVV